MKHDYQATYPLYFSPRMFVNIPNYNHPECGTSVNFGNTSNGPVLSLVYTNNPNECCRVRLMRNLSNDQW